MAEKNDKNKKRRRRIKAEEIVFILRELMVGGRKVSELATEYDIHPNQILNWRKELFEGAADIFVTKRPDITEKAQRRKIEDMEKSIAAKDSVIAEIAQENLILKKNLNGRF